MYQLKNTAFVVVIVSALLMGWSAPAAAQGDAAILTAALEALAPRNVVALDLGGSSLDALGSAVGYSRRLWQHAAGDLALYVGVSHPVGSLTGANLDGHLDLSGLDWKFSDVDRGLLAPHIRLQVHPLVAFTAQFGDVCVVHMAACDGYVYARITADVRFPWRYTPFTVRLGREGLLGDGKLDGEWLRALSVGSTVGW